MQRCSLAASLQAKEVECTRNVTTGQYVKPRWTSPMNSKKSNCISSAIGHTNDTPLRPNSKKTTNDDKHYVCDGKQNLKKTLHLSTTRHSALSRPIFVPGCSSTAGASSSCTVRHYCTMPEVETPINFIGTVAPPKQ